MGMDFEYVPAPARPRLHRRILGEIGRRIEETYKYDTTLWRTALAGLWTICFLVFTLTMLGIPTGFGVPADILLAAIAGTLVLSIAGNALAVLLALTGLRIPRLYAGSLLSTAGIILLILYYADLEIEAAAVAAGLATLIGAVAGIALGLLRSRRILTGLLLALVLVLSPFALAAGSGQNTDPAKDLADLSSGVAPLAADNPGIPGNYAVTSFTYGTGKDLHRAEYGQEVDLVSASADASVYIKKWQKLRSLFWGFDSSALPINGRVWMPEGEGPFPLVLMVHGNHMMEDYSDGGYAYLGELLASRGFIAISLDENFLNYSAWSGIPDNDFKVRAWMILKHLEQIGEFSQSEGNPFYQKVDYAHTALLGHSRGGQAVAMAADAGRWFKADAVLTAIAKFHITSVVAIAPTDKAVDGLQARLSDVNYLTLQGARDGDVHDFYGDRQYIRNSYSHGSSAFKSSLYIEDANHSQFNTDWGLSDQSFPTGLFLSRGSIMDGEQQRQIAKVYVSAFLETTLHGDTGYTGLFRDYRTALAWLPDTNYINRFQNGGFRQVANFDEDRNKKSAGRSGTIDAAGLRWIEEPAKDRESKSKATYGVVLERTALAGAEASYTINLQDSTINDVILNGAAGLSFSMSNLNKNPDGESGIPPSPDVEIELTDSNQVSSRIPLAEIRPILPLPQTWFTLTPWLEERISNHKYGDLSEAVFQTYEMPFGAFKKQAPDLNPDQITAITFYLDKTGDSIMLDDIGFYDHNVLE
ncbi:alpha/beta hydrolase [Paenibacillus sp. sgz500958]|uniref:poly(ethylene terephthalate) hydrolase family protein n=1 Tax=Paenibacillus sp. sgz500958 TaxID=3242475 RepID=UPI0036D303EE